jgi:hypothetical protein
MQSCEHLLYNTLLRVDSLTCNFVTSNGPRGQATESGLIVKAMLTVAKQFEVAFMEKPLNGKGKEFPCN